MTRCARILFRGLTLAVLAAAATAQTVTVTTSADAIDIDPSSATIARWNLPACISRIRRLTGALYHCHVAVTPRLRDTLESAEKLAPSQSTRPAPTVQAPSPQLALSTRRPPGNEMDRSTSVAASDDALSMRGLIDTVLSTAVDSVPTLTMRRLGSLSRLRNT